MTLSWIIDNERYLMLGRCQALEESGLFMAIYFIGRPVLVLLDRVPPSTVPAESDCLLYMQAQSNCKIGLVNLMQAGQLWLEYGRQAA